MKNKRLAYIQALMIISQLLLVAMTVSWLDAQYKEERVQLTKELEATLASSQKEISDSMLYHGILQPLLKSEKSPVKKNVRFSSKIGAGSLNIVIDDSKHDVSTLCSDSVKGRKKFREIQRILMDGGVDTSKIKMRTVVSDVRQTATYTSKDGKTAEKLLMNTINMLMTEMVKDSGASQVNVFTLDTAHLKTVFAKNLQKQGQHFDMVWNSTTDISKKEKPITISSEYYTHAYKVSIYGYKYDLFKYLLPQIIFSLLLLSLVGTAFIVTFKSLKKQMRLSTMKNDFISNMSHELKTPISTVKVALEALSTFNMAENPRTAKDYLEMASLEMTRLDLLVNQALNTSMLEEGKIVIQKECIDVKAMAGHILQLLDWRFKQTAAVVSMEAEGAQFTTMADRLHLQGVIINLLDNSLKYAGKDPRIHLSLRENADKLVITVADNGPGIPEEHIRHIFEKFYRVPHGNKHNVKGYGLGLSYAQQIIRQHGGEIHAQNQPEGGCKFTIIIPKILC